MKDLLYEYLKKYHVGKDNAITSRDLQGVFQCCGVEIREMVNALRCEGKPICSDKSGYYVASNPSELSCTIKNLKGRCSAILSAIQGLEGVSQ